MALKTQGFALSSLGSAPDIPSNVGKIDVQSIYDRVKQGLQTNEMMRTALAQQQATDAALQAEAAQAPLRTAILAENAAQAPIGTSLLADKAALSGGTLPGSIAAENATNAGTTVQTPYRTAILAAQASPEMLAAQRQALLARGIPTDVRSFELLTQGMTPEQKERARLIHFGNEARTSSAAIQYKEVVGPDGVTRLVAVDPRAVGAQVVGTGETFGSGVGGRVLAAPAVAPAVVGAAPVPTVAPTVFASAPEAQQKSADTTAAEMAKLQVERQQKLPKAQQALKLFEDQASNLETTIDKAIKLTDSTSAGLGSMLSGIPTTDARALKALLTTIRARMGFGELQEMRNNSPTGGALGQVSDNENVRLDSATAALDQGLAPAELKEALETVRDVRRQALQRVRDAYSTDFKLAAEGGTTTPPAAQNQEALQWVNDPANANDPRLPAIRRKLGL